MSLLFNSKTHFGWASIVLHWLLAIALIGLYFLGDYMVELEYYDTWYHKAPAIHKATGIIVVLFMLFRFFWNNTQSKPQPLNNSKPALNKLASLGHYSLYLFVFLLFISGYLISTAKGQGIDVFGLFELPALLGDSAERGELAGKIHEIIATIFILTVAIHALAALMHHFVFKDPTLKRMLGINK